MGLRARSWLLVVIVGALVSLAVPGVAQAAPGIAKFEALSCATNEPIGKPGECSNSTPGKWFTQAGGHQPFGITDFIMNVGEFEAPGNGIKSIRTDLPVGVSTNPEAIARCSQADFAANLGKAEESHCPASSQSGLQEVTILIEPKPKEVVPFEITGKVYSLVPAQGLGLEFGIDLPLAFLGGIHVHSFLEGFVSWHHEKEAEEEGIESGDYHEFFKIKTAKSLTEGEAPILRSRLITFGNLGSGLLRNPTSCAGPGQTSHLRVETFAGTVATSKYETSTTAAEEKCNLLSFEPGFGITTSSQTRDEGTELTTDLKFPSNTKGSETEGSDMKTSVVTLPEGFTINPAASRGLQACTSAQLHTETIETECPSRSEIGQAVISVPGLPPETLQGKIFLGASSVPITGPPYKIYVAVSSKRYGQVIRLEGTVEPNLETGQLKTTFANVPQGPSTDTKLMFNGGVFSDLANPLKCGTQKATANFIPYANPGEVKTIQPELTVAGGTCPSTAAFSPTQSAGVEPGTAGGSNTFTINVQRPDGQQYLKTMKTVLPKGLVGLIPTVTQCPEPQAAQGTCASASQIGTASVLAGAGPEPFEFTGRVYLTGPYQGAPFGLSIVTPVVAGPFNFGNEITRAKIEVNPETAQVVASTTLPTIKQGVPVKLRSLTVTVNRQGFERNPTNCGVLATETTFGSTEGATSTASTPFQVEGCGSLAFKPSFAAASTAKFSRQNGASLETTLNMQSGGANVKSVKVTLPKALPSRLTTLQKACLETTFNTNPLSCPAASMVGGVRANTPTLPAKMSGPAILVSHGGRAFPDLDLVLEGNGVRVILVGNTDIKNGITTTTFASTPDVPVSSITVNLPTGPHSALAAFGDLCRSPLFMPTEMTGQNGKTFKQNTRINVKGCGVKVVGQKVIGGTVFLTVKTFGKGRVIGSGSGVSSRSRTFNSAQNGAALNLPRNRGGSTTIRVRFISKQRGVPSSSTTVRVRL